MIFIRLRKFPSILSLFSVFIMKVYWVLPNTFSVFMEVFICFVLYSLMSCIAIHSFLSLFLRYFLTLKHLLDGLNILTNFESQKASLKVSTGYSVQEFPVLLSFDGFVCLVQRDI